MEITGQRPNYRAKHGETSSREVFSNPILEALSRTHISVPISFYFILSAGLLYWAIINAQIPWYTVTALFFGGWLTFTFIEYIMHRFVFHMRITTKFRHKLQYTAHGVHHEYPKDKSRLAMPMPASIFLAVFLFGFFWLFLRTYTYGFLPGMLVGYATYLLVHFVVHAYAPPKNFLKGLWVRHALHHYKDDSVIFGVSSPIWDYVFGTTAGKAKNKYDGA